MYFLGMLIRLAVCSLNDSSKVAKGRAPMTESTANQTLAQFRDERTPIGPVPEAESAAALRIQSIVAELVGAVRSMLSGDRDSAQASVDRVAEMIACGVGSGIAAAATGDSKSDVIPSSIRGGLAPWQVRRVTAHIESHLGGSITTQDLATIAKVSTYHFTRAFRESVSETPHVYVMRRRVERAQGLMLTTNIALGQIAIDCGFADQAHFNKLFRRSTGQSPGAWRRARAIAPHVRDIHTRAIELGASP